jgi:hypothetical protein
LEKLKGKRTLETTRRRWGKTIRIYLKKIRGSSELDKCDSIQGALSGSFEHGNEPSVLIE